MAKIDAIINVIARDKTAAAMLAINSRFAGMTKPLARIGSSMRKTFDAAGVTALGASVSGLGRSLSNVPVAGTLLALGGIAAATAAIVRNSIQAHDALGRIKDLSDAFKVSKRDLQVFAEVGADSGVAMDDIARSMGFLQQRIADAQRGNRVAIKLFADVGVDRATLDRGVSDVFMRISDTFMASKLESDDALKVDLSKALLGKAGTSMVPLMDEGGANILDMMRKMQAEGRLFTDAQIDQADRVGDAWGASMRRVDAIKRKVGLAMGPAIESMSSAIDRLLSLGGGAQLVAAFKSIGNTISQEAPKLLGAIPAIVAGIGRVFKAINSVASLVGWDKLIFGTMALIAAPFVASAVSVASAAVKVGMGAFDAAQKILVMARVMSVQWVAALSISQGALLATGVSASAAWLAVLGPIAAVAAAVVAASAFLVANWGGIKAFFGGVWDGLVTGMQPVFNAFSGFTAAVKPMIGALSSLFSSSSEDVSAWANAGVVAGALIADIFKAMLIPITLVIDAIKIAVAGFNVLRGGEFAFTSTTKAILSPSPTATAPAVPRLNTLSAPKIVRTDVGGRLDININSRGVASVARIETKNPAFTYTARAGQMFATP